VILRRYTEARRFFALAGAPLAPDGLPAWPGPLNPDGSFSNTSAGRLRAGGFSATLQAWTSGAHSFGLTTIGPLVDPAKFPTGDPVWPLDVFCVLPTYTQDAVYGVHEYDWWVSLRREVGRAGMGDGTALVEWDAPALDVTMPDPSSSGRISIAPNLPAVAALLPGLAGGQLLTAESIATLFRHVHVFVQRRADKAIQWARLYEA
jgi:hypothetical protein